ncbi:MAG: hypothetical protein RI907_339 [Pseudomonadota bacterium]
MSAGHFLRIERIGAKKGVGVKAARLAACHNLRTIQAELGCDSHIDASRVHLNEVLHGASDPDGVAAAWACITTLRGVTSYRKNACSVIEAVFSLPRGHAIDAGAYFRDCLRWLAARFGGMDNVISAVVHNDEAQPHMHMLVVPLLEVPGRGWKLCANDMLGDLAAVKSMQSAFGREVAERYGLKRVGPLRGEAKRGAVALVLGHLRHESDPVMQSAVWAQVRASIEADPAPFVDALGLEAPAPKAKKLRSMDAIFTSPGKGPKYEREAMANPY